MTDTPLMRQYKTLKSNYTDALLLFQMGDFYECFFDDAVEISKALNIVLTKREKRADAPPMAGFPIKSLDDYLKILIDKGYKVAVAKQLSANSEAGEVIVERKVCEVVTKGTITSIENLERSRSNYLAAVIVKKSKFAFTILEITTGEFKYIEGFFADKSDILELINSFDIAELVVPSGSEYNFLSGKYIIQPLDKSHFELTYAEKLIKEHFGVANLDSFMLDNKELAVATVGAIFSYIKLTKDFIPQNIKNLELLDINDYMQIDSTSMQNLEIFYNIRGKSEKNSLVSILDRTETAMGSRLLRSWLRYPLKNKERIEARINNVQKFFTNFDECGFIRKELSKMYDLQRLLGSLGLKRILPKQVIMIKHTLRHSFKLMRFLKTKGLNFSSEGGLNSNFEPLDSSFASSASSTAGINMEKIKRVYNLIKRSLLRNPNNDTNSGFIFKRTYNKKLAELRKLTLNSKQILEEILERERKNSQIPNLKLSFNKVFGYYFEVSRSNIKNVPPYFIRKQTLVNGERYITEEVKMLESRILSAQDELITLEKELYAKFIEDLMYYIEELQKVSKFIAELDVFTNLAYVSMKNNYAKPSFIPDSHTGTSFKLVDSRNPIVEVNTENFITNSIELGKEKNFVILTGPNMGGKSTFIRQIALIQIMAQIGCFVPCANAELTIKDKIFARIGASDDIATGRSTFMVEMSEVSYILRSATEKSLIVLDEVGRGTGTLEGIALAESICLYISNRIRADTVFATHYHELRELEGKYPYFINYKVDVEEQGKNVYFLHSISRGYQKKSYGIHIAKLAGFPKEIIVKAEKRLQELEKQRAQGASEQLRLGI